MMLEVFGRDIEHRSISLAPSTVTVGEQALKVVKEYQEFDDSCIRTITEYECNAEVELAGDSIWGCDLERVTITSMDVEKYSYKGEEHTNICVKHSGGEDSWTMYTDTGFEAAVGNLLGYSVSFTEQGMQEDGLASLEAY